MKTLLAVLLIAVVSSHAQSFVEQQREREWVREAGEKPTDIEPKTKVPLRLLEMIQSGLKDPESFRFIGTSGVQRARWLSNNKPLWACRVDYDGKNSYGGYTGGTSDWFCIVARDGKFFWKRQGKYEQGFKLEVGGIIKTP